MPCANSNPVDPERVLWDAIIIGAGMGGGTLGYSLAQAGRRVVFLEKGPNTLPYAAGVTVRGRVAEDLGALADGDTSPQTLDALRRTGRSIDEVDDVTTPRIDRFVPYLGCGVGGSSALYGMALERFFPSDFTPRQNFRDAGPSTVPEAWPLSYEQMTPWYAAAEALYGMSGEPDPLRPWDEVGHLRPPPPLEPVDAAFFHDLTCRGLHPYRLHMACGHTQRCGTCPGYLCPQNCRHDAASRCVAPAIHQYGARLLSDCTVEHIEANRTRVTDVGVLWRKQRLRLRGRVVAAAAGGLMSPVLLLRSRSSAWPYGVGNQHDQVGRHLMRHGIGLYVVRLNQSRSSLVPFASYGFNDFYQTDSGKLGNVQAVAMPPLGLALSSRRPIFRVLRQLKPLLNEMWERRKPRLVGLGTILEDLPYRDNRVQPADSGDACRQRVQIRYRPGESERSRTIEFHRRIHAALQSHRFRQVPLGNENRIITHVCGACRFGHDPKTSVLDPNNRVHGLENLYVVDASFFPSSAGVNPSLTIAANALRVAAEIHARLDSAGELS